MKRLKLSLTGVRSLFEIAYLLRRRSSNAMCNKTSSKYEVLMLSGWQFLECLFSEFVCALSFKELGDF